jgi:hypothetical protein
MRHTLTDGPGSTVSEALDAASGGLVFAMLVAIMGAVAGLAGWAAGVFPTATILLGCAVLSALIASAVWGVLHWGVDEPLMADDFAVQRDDRHGFRHAA